ncbi:hypothetical protein D3C81_1369580 [compost metagenome]
MVFPYCLILNKVVSLLHFIRDDRKNSFAPQPSPEKPHFKKRIIAGNENVFSPMKRHVIWSKDKYSKIILVKL